MNCFHRQSRHILRIIAALVFIGLSLQAQQGPPSVTTHAEIQVRVTFDNDRSAGDQIRVDLLNDTGIAVQQNFTDSEGRVSFFVTSPGNYQVRASGLKVESGLSEQVRIDEMDRSRMIFVRVKPKVDNTQSVQSAPGQGTTSAAQLRIPPDARKAFGKGMDAWEKKDYQKAADDFEKAVALYPQYDAAYNNLGVMYAHLDQNDKAKAAFERSVQLNDKNADADRNLAKMLLHQQDFARAEDLLHKSLSVEPLNPISLTMLSVAEFENGQIDQALIDARKVHEVPHEGYALSHFVAGQALELKHQYTEASAEYITYLRESPNGPESSAVRSALAKLTAASTAPPPPNSQ